MLNVKIMPYQNHFLLIITIDSCHHSQIIIDNFRLNVCSNHIYNRIKNK